MKKYIEKFDKWLDSVPNIKRLLFAFAGIKSVPILVILAGISIGSSPFIIPILMLVFGKNIDFKDFTASEPIQLVIGVLLIFLGCLLNYCEQKSNKLNSSNSIQPKKSKEIHRTKDLQLFHK